MNNYRIQQGGLWRCLCCGLLYDYEKEWCPRWSSSKFLHTLEYAEIVFSELTKRNCVSAYDPSTHRKVLKFSKYLFTLQKNKEKQLELEAEKQKHNYFVAEPREQLRLDHRGHLI